MEWYANNREVIKDLAFNTGTTAVPSFTITCTASEIGLTTDINSKTFYVFCDALQREVITGGAVGLQGTLKLDLNNTANTTLLAKIHTLIASGEVSQFTDLIQFKLLSGISGSTLTYTKYQVLAVIKLSDLGGSAEDEADFSFEINFQGTATEVTSS